VFSRAVRDYGRPTPLIFRRLESESSLARHQPEGTLLLLQSTEEIVHFCNRLLSRLFGSFITATSAVAQRDTLRRPAIRNWAKVHLNFVPRTGSTAYLFKNADGTCDVA
jgi:hypothetical protein